MRRAFIQTLCRLAAEDSRVLLLTADLGYSVLEPFADRFPSRFINVGVAEQNMVGLATGLAESGFIPFIYSITPFASLRPYEFIRNGPVLHQLSVRIIGVGGGFDYEASGPTHFALEDVGVMRIQPGLRVVVPADFEQTKSALESTWSAAGPTYYRLGKDDQSVVPGLGGQFSPDRVQRVREGNDLAIVSMGSVSCDAVRAAELLESHGISCAVRIVAALNPPPSIDLADSLRKFRQVMTVEEHYTTGGLGSLVAETVADHGLGCTVLRQGVQRAIDGISGRKDFLNDLHGFSPTALVKAAIKLLHASSVPA